MTATLTAFADLERADLDRWDQLALDSPEPNPFHGPGFVTAAARLGPREPHLLIVHEGERWDACLPVSRTTAGRPPLPAVRTWHTPYLFLGTPLLRAGAGEQAMGELLALGRAQRTCVFALDQVDPRGTAGVALVSAAAAAHLPLELKSSHERALLNRRPEPADYVTGKRAHHRRELARLGRRLAQDLGEIRVVDRRGEPGATADFMALELAGWKGQAGTAMASTAAGSRFFEEICRRFAERQCLQMLALYAGDSLVAMKCNLIAGEGIFCFKIAHDERLSRYSPGVQLELANIEIFHQGTAAWMDSCAQPGNKMINSLWPDRRAIATLATPARGLIRGAPARAMAAGQRINRRRRSHDAVR
ncbi:MAG: hypothetical protein QOG62_1317 [Thermoleophilaceae bacterium]|jgi:CelD/BcsL family acetyltransferase involved in cellulose biosynthesis|nr:hypothetical protein [Thermoleophilaceae bacterium]